MVETFLLVAKEKEGLLAIASADSLTILNNTIQSFDGLDTFSEPPLSNVGVIRTGKKGWICMAVEN